jgi:hypothetical protein
MLDMGSAGTLEYAGPTPGTWTIDQDYAGVLNGTVHFTNVTNTVNSAAGATYVLQKWIGDITLGDGPNALSIWETGHYEHLTFGPPMALADLRLKPPVLPAADPASDGAGLVRASAAQAAEFAAAFSALVGSSAFEAIMASPNPVLMLMVSAGGSLSGMLYQPGAGGYGLVKGLSEIERILAFMREPLAVSSSGWTWSGGSSGDVAAGPGQGAEGQGPGEGAGQGPGQSGGPSAPPQDGPQAGQGQEGQGPDAPAGEAQDGQAGGEGQ